MGDIGSMGVAFWVLALVGLLMMKTQDIKYILFLTVYGVDVVLTIVERFKLKENIFEAHRRHLYQLFSNEKKVSHLIISSIYTLLQLIINVLVILLKFPNWFIFAMIILPILLLYIIIKYYIKKNLHVNKNEN